MVMKKADNPSPLMARIIGFYFYMKYRSMKLLLVREYLTQLLIKAFVAKRIADDDTLGIQ